MADKTVDLSLVRTQKAVTSDDGTAWTPRDMLIEAIKDIDSGALKLKRAILIYAEEDGNINYYSSNVNLLEALGMMEVNKRNM